MEKAKFNSYIYSGGAWKRARPYIKNQKANAYIFINTPILNSYQYPNTITKLTINRGG